MLKNGKSENRKEHQNRETEVFCHKNRKTENPNAPLVNPGSNLNYAKKFCSKGVGATVMI